MNTRLCLIALCAAMFTACGDTPTAPPDRAVIEGYIDSDGYVTVYFTSSLNPAGSGPVEDKLIRWGTVTVDDGTAEYALTGGLTTGRIPPYSYYSYDFKGIPGRTYTITANYRGLSATATSTMPRPTPVDSISLAPIAGNDTLRAATLHFTAPDDCPAYYYVTLREATVGSRSYPGLMGLAEVNEPGADISVPVCRPKLLTDTLKYVPQLRTGTRYEVTLCRVERDVYRYWQAFNEAVMFGGSLFTGGGSSLPGNVEGGYGIWCARGVSTVNLEVK